MEFASKSVPLLDRTVMFLICLERLTGPVQASCVLKSPWMFGMSRVPRAVTDGSRDKVKSSHESSGATFSSAAMRVSWHHCTIAERFSCHLLAWKRERWAEEGHPWKLAWPSKPCLNNKKTCLQQAILQVAPVSAEQRRTKTHMQCI